MGPGICQFFLLFVQYDVLACIGCVTRNKVFGPTLVVFAFAKLLLFFSFDFADKTVAKHIKMAGHRTPVYSGF